MAINKYLGVQGLNELVTLFKNDISKKQDIIQYIELPDPVRNVGKIFQYIGADTIAYKKGNFYYSNGLSWQLLNLGEGGEAASSFEVVTALPMWEDADVSTLYFVVGDTNVLKGYIKNPATTDKWYTIGGEGAEQADYLLNEGDTERTVFEGDVTDVLAQNIPAAKVQDMLLRRFTFPAVSALPSVVSPAYKVATGDLAYVEDTVDIYVARVIGTSILWDRRTY